MGVVARSRRQFLRGSLALLGLSLASGCSRLPLADTARRATRPRIGVLWVGVAGPSFGMFRQALRERGYADSADIIFESRFYSPEHEELLPGLAAELARLPVDVLVASGPAAIEAARRTTATIPIVMMGGSAAVETELVASLARPGGNLTGESSPPSIGGKRLELLRQAVVGAARIAVLWMPSGEQRFTVLNAQATADALKVDLKVLDLQNTDDLERAFEAAATWHADALMVQDSPSFGFHESRIVRLASTHRLPTIYGGRGFVDVGGLMAYGANQLEVFRLGAAYVDKILKGAKPADLPVELPSVFDFTVNLRTAEELGLTVPPSLLHQATAVVQ